MELFCLTDNKKLMSVEVKTSGVFEANVPKPLFETYAPDYDVTADGQRFLLNNDSCLIKSRKRLIRPLPSY